jgi:SAM-dependent methyltransferase
MAQQIAAERGLDIHFEVGDVCELPLDGKQYDLIVDSYCLQCIVFDAERSRLYSSIRARLKPGGYYLVSSAVLDREHEELIGGRTTRDSRTGTVYTEYDSGLIDLETGIVLQPFEGASKDYPDMMTIDGQGYLPHRRHLRPADLAAELAAAGFTVLFRDQNHAGSIACKLTNAAP